MTIIIVTGTPGTGKTTFSKEYAKKHSIDYIDVTKLIADKQLSEGYDKQKLCEIVEENRLNEELIKIITDSRKKSKSIIIDSHMSHNLPKEYVDKCFVTKCELKELKARLEKKGYPAEKVRENLDAEILDICLNEAEEKGHKVEIINTSSENQIKKKDKKIKTKK